MIGRQPPRPDIVEGSTIDAAYEEPEVSTSEISDPRRFVALFYSRVARLLLSVQKLSGALDVRHVGRCPNKRMHQP